MDHNKTLGEKGNTEMENETKEPNKKRRCDSLEDYNAHKKKKTGSCERVKHCAKTRKRGDETHMRPADCDQEMKNHNKKRKGEGMEDCENHKRRKVNGVEGLTGHKNQRKEKDEKDKRR